VAAGADCRQDPARHPEPGQDHAGEEVAGPSRDAAGSQRGSRRRPRPRGDHIISTGRPPADRSSTCRTKPAAGMSRVDPVACKQRIDPPARGFVGYKGPRQGTNRNARSAVSTGTASRPPRRR
jgi:hypothetical protein